MSGYPKSGTRVRFCFVNENLGLSLNETLATATAKNRIPVLLTNATNKTYKLKKECVIGRVDIWVNIKLNLSNSKRVE